MANEYLKEIIEASIAVQAAEARLTTALTKWRANTNADAKPIGDVKLKKECVSPNCGCPTCLAACDCPDCVATRKAADPFKLKEETDEGSSPPIYPPVSVRGAFEKKQRPLGDVSKTLVLALLAQDLDPKTVVDLDLVARNMPEPWNTRIPVSSTMRTLFKRGLVKRKNGEDAQWVIPSNEALRSAMGWGA